jgi:secreted PhoX family phosphatase
MKLKTMTLAVIAALTAAAQTQAGSIQFEEVPFPATDAEKRSVLASPSAVVNGSTVAIGFNTILRSGDEVGGGVFGQLVDAQGNPLLAADGSHYISSDNDFSSLLTGKQDGKLYMVSHFESRPAAMYLTELNQNPTTGSLTAVRTRPLDFSPVRGGWVHCAGSVTPWGTHLGSEEYEPDASLRNPATGSIDDYYNAMGAYYGGDLLALNPYDYGWNVEVRVNSYDKANVTKHYTMGRFAWELGYVMPNKKTVYASDDGTDVGLFRFEADKAGDLSSGTLYAAKWLQTSPDGAPVGYAQLAWVNLGHASDAHIRELYLNKKITFGDLFAEKAPTKKEDGTYRCPAQFTLVKHTYGLECLKVKPGMDIAASRLETRRYAALKGATTEWRKMEGITYNPDMNQLYIAMSEINKGMEDKADGGRNDIRVALNDCGAVYALDLDPNFVAHTMHGIVVGDPTSGTDDKNKCNIAGIANPDNITYMPGYDTLIIGEDSGSGHQNDAIWSYNTRKGTLTRIETTPYGAESTSPYFYPNVNGFAYLMSVVQHPYGESDQDQLDNPANARAYTGYIGPFPAMKK